MFPKIIEWEGQPLHGLTAEQRRAYLALMVANRRFIVTDSGDEYVFDRCCQCGASTADYCLCDNA